VTVLSRPNYEKRLAELAVRVGANVQPGQDVVVLAMDVEMAPVARAVVEAAYRAGARIVSLVYWDAHAKRSRLLHAADESIGIVPDWYERLGSESLENRGAQIILWGEPHPGLLDDVDAGRAGRDHMPLTPAMFETASAGTVAWTIVPGPCPGIARRLLGEPDVDALWRLLAPLVRIDADDPAVAWEAHVAQLARRAASIEERRFHALHFRGPGPI
jgi:aminopeptidase